ncbi:hypothetical protein RRG08_044435, partial [Elysia crispata]
SSSRGLRRVVSVIVINVARYESCEFKKAIFKSPDMLTFNDKMFGTVNIDIVLSMTTGTSSFCILSVQSNYFLIGLTGHVTPLCRKGMPYDWKKGTLVVMNEPIIGQKVLCDTLFGWIYIQRRIDGIGSFYQLWSRYANGFGDVDNDHWLGLEAIHNLTYSGYADLVIRVDDSGKFYDLYVSGFKVKDAKH